MDEACSSVKIRVKGFEADTCNKKKEADTTASCGSLPSWHAAAIMARRQRCQLSNSV
jgi:hypothetical protein